MLFRFVAGLALTLALAATAAAHFVYIVPQASDKVRVVFSDTLEPDGNVPITKIAGTKLFVRGANGKSTALSWAKVENAYEVTIPGSGSRMVYGMTDYGVLQKDKSQPFLLRYYPKAIVGPVPTDGGKLGDVAIEIVPILSKGKWLFEVLAKGKPVADAKVTLLMAGDKHKTLKTDAKGRTEATELTGKCGASVRHTAKVSGKAGGKAYEEARHYATLVFDAAGK